MRLEGQYPPQDRRMGFDSGRRVGWGGHSTDITAGKDRSDFLGKFVLKKYAEFS